MLKITLVGENKRGERNRYFLERERESKGIYRLIE